MGVRQGFGYNVHFGWIWVDKMKQEQFFDVVIIGAGASGLFCAFSVAQTGKSVLVLDHANKAGKKILMSGGGRCNFTNLDVGAQHFISQNPHFVRSALTKFTPQHFLAYIYKHGVAFHEKSHGQLFCDNASSDILNLLLDECADAGVAIWLDTAIDEIDAQDGFTLTTTHKKTKQIQTIGCHSLVVATGGLSIPTLGASGFGYQVASQFGHQIVPTVPSLVSFTFTDGVGELFKSLSGVSLDVVAFNDKASFELPLLFTHRGLSGPAMLQLSNYWQAGESITVNLSPKLDIGDYLINYKKEKPKQLIRTALAPHFAKKLLTALENHFWQHLANTELANIKDKTLIQIGQQLNHWQLKPAGTEGYRVAEVTRGGVDTSDVSSKTFESKLQPNLYFIGEVLDVAGWLGGYNFQWAWASAFACASAIAKTQK